MIKSQYSNIVNTILLAHLCLWTQELSGYSC